MLKDIQAIEKRVNLGGGEKFHFDGVNSFVNWLNEKGYDDKGDPNGNQILDSSGTPIGEFAWNKDKSIDVVIGTGLPDDNGASEIENIVHEIEDFCGGDRIEGLTQLPIKSLRILSDNLHRR